MTRPPTAATSDFEAFAVVERLALEHNISGRDKIDHPRGTHDDIANAVAGALVFAYQGLGYAPGQRLRDNMKLEQAYKRLARSFA